MSTPRSRRWLLPVLCVSLLGTLAPRSPARQSVRLNGPLALGTRSGDITHYAYTPDGTRIVYRADREADQKYELYSRPLDGSGPSLRLNGPMQAQGDVGVNGNSSSGFAIAAGGRVVYLADETTDEVVELFSVPADGSASRIRLSEAGLSVFPFALDPVAPRVVFQHGSYPVGSGPLLVVPIDGSAPAIVLTPGKNVHRFWISPDGATTVFSAQATLDQEDLFAVPTDGSAPPVFLARSHLASVAITAFLDATFTQDGLRVVYNEVEDLDGDLQYQLFSAPLDGGQAPQLLASLHAGTFLLDSGAPPQRAVFQAGGGAASALVDGGLATTFDLQGWSLRSVPQVQGKDVFFDAFRSALGRTLLRVPSDGSLPATPLLTPGTFTILSFAPVSATQLAYIRSDTARQLEVVPIAGGPAIALHPPAPAGRGPGLFTPVPGGLEILFNSNIDPQFGTELYLAPLDGSQPPTKLSPPMATNVGVGSITVTPDGAHAAYLANTSSPAHSDLLVVPLDGSRQAFQVDEPHFTTTAGDVLAFQATPDESRVVYLADETTAGELDLFVVDALGRRFPLTGALPGVLPDFLLSPAGERVVFQTLDTLFSLRASLLASGSSVELDSAPEAFPFPFQVSADGARLVYRRSAGAGTFELYSVALDGLSAPLRLHPPLAPGRSVSAFEVGAERVAFLADLEQADVFELYSVPLTGGTPLRLDRTPVAGGDVLELRLDSSGTTAAYLADALVDGRNELFSVPIDGSLPPRLLNGPLGPNGDVTDFAFAAGDTRVVYRADQRSNDRFELFSVPIRGPLPPHARPGGERQQGPTLLSALPAGRAVSTDWRLSPDGTQVVYRANPGSFPLTELFRAPVDGRAPPTKLNAPLVAGGKVLDFELARDGSRVVYRAEQRLLAVNELFSVPLAGGPVAALDVLPSFADVSTFHVNSTSTKVSYLANRNDVGVPELFRVPIAGGAPPHQESASLIPGGSIQLDFLPLAFGTLYRADQLEDEVLELFLAP